MPGRKPRTSRVLILIAVLMSLAFGLAVPQSSSTPSPLEGQHMPDMFVAKDSDSDTDADVVPTLQKKSRLMTAQRLRIQTRKPHSTRFLPKLKKEPGLPLMESGIFL